jgi:phosphorylcholine metabolism protein LicD
MTNTPTWTCCWLQEGIVLLDEPTSITITKVVRKKGIFMQFFGVTQEVVSPSQSLKWNKQACKKSTNLQKMK